VLTGAEVAAGGAGTWDAAGATAEAFPVGVAMTFGESAVASSVVGWATVAEGAVAVGGRSCGVSGAAGALGTAAGIVGIVGAEGASGAEALGAGVGALGAATGTALTSISSEWESSGAAGTGLAMSESAPSVQQVCKIRCGKFLFVTGLFQILGAHDRAPLGDGARSVTISG